MHALTVPCKLDCDKYVLLSVATYQCNRLHPQYNAYTSHSWTVLQALNNPYRQYLSRSFYVHRNYVVLLTSKCILTTFNKNTKPIGTCKQSNELIPHVHVLFSNSFFNDVQAHTKTNEK